MKKMIWECRKCEEENALETTAKQVIIGCNGCGSNHTIQASVSLLTDKPRYREKVWLERQYAKEGRTMQSIADDFGVSPMTIYGWLKQHDIRTRGRGTRL